jgi:hypothetical protein
MMTYTSKAVTDIGIEAEVSTSAAEAVWEIRGNMMGSWSSLDQSPNYCLPSTYFINTKIFAIKHLVTLTVDWGFLPLVPSRVTSLSYFVFSSL